MVSNPLFSIWAEKWKKPESLRHWYGTKTIMTFKFCFSKCCKKTFFFFKISCHNNFICFESHCEKYVKAGKANWRGRRLGTVDLLINVACLNNVCGSKSSWCKLVSTRRSNVLRLPFSETSLVNYSSIYTFGQGIQSEGECPVQLTSSLRKLVL